MRKKSILLLEVFIWILLLGGLIFLGISAVKNRLDNQKSYEVVFKDVDSLIVGSPVRVMGIDVGHVTAVKPFGNEVYVTFIITNNQVALPIGSIASVQFTGLAGSKSLEIAPPKIRNHGTSSLYVIEPIRINSLIALQVEMSESILYCAKNALKFFGSGGDKGLKNHIDMVATATGQIYSKIHNTRAIISDIDAPIKTNLKNAQKVLNEQDKNIETINDSIYKQKISENAKQNIKLLNANMQGLENSLKDENVSNISNNITKNSRNIHKHSANLDQNLKYAKDKNLFDDQAAQRSFNGFNNVVDMIRNAFYPDRIDKLYSKTQKAKQVTKKTKDSI